MIFNQYLLDFFQIFFKIILTVLILLLSVAYLTYLERKLIGWMHARIGPNRVGFLGLLQPIADTLKLLLKEITVPKKANKFLFFLAPIISIMPAIAVWSIIPFSPEYVFSNINSGLLFIMTITSIEIYGVIIAGWSSNSKYAFLGSMRASAQMISYEIVMGFCLVIILMVTGSLNLTKIVINQNNGYFSNIGLSFLSWNWLSLFPIFIIYIISCIAETNRHPFDIVEGESEIVAGYMIDYSGMSFYIFFLAEYANMILSGILISLLFLGGWIAPLKILNFIPFWIWLGIKTFFILFIFIWIRASFPRYRYDQIMRLGWKIFIPIILFFLIIYAFWIKSPLNIWK
ncbi:NADH-quinone oxidoreductase subunit NuoH [Candidatus Profftella armatura]|uniref:NADH-quinone oxidoreductase subunit NuoH n=1 Tax=Candidatus Profftella armatura TaxID=669502 RepID=UPI003D98C202